VLNPPLTSRQIFHPGDTLAFDLTLIGPAMEALPYFVYLFNEQGRRGLGQGRGKYELFRVEVQQSGADLTVYETTTGLLNAFAPESGPAALPGDEHKEEVNLEFLTPLRLKEKGDLVTRLNFPVFFNALSRRLRLLGTFYGDGANVPDFSPLQTQVMEIVVKNNGLRWFDWERYSCRQDAAMKFGGLVGRLTLTGPLGPLLPYLRLGATLNIGQATTFGLGRHVLK
jgi:hypothetical protein